MTIARAMIQNSPMLNVDCMHTIAGSQNVAEIQGSLQVNCCEKCGRYYDTYEIWRQKELPLCEVLRRIDPALAALQPYRPLG
ncbi:MAG: hypothetical protein LUE24_09380 [Lachnospiraceae bacterium]|nr:hypothetical protein [Lachnospiraceae bacterium]